MGNASTIFSSQLEINIYNFLQNEFRNQPKRKLQHPNISTYSNIEKVSPGNYISTSSSETSNATTNLNSLFYVQGESAKNFIAQYPGLFKITNNDTFGCIQFCCNGKLVEKLQSSTKKSAQ